MAFIIYLVLFRQGVIETLQRIGVTTSSPLSSSSNASTENVHVYEAHDLDKIMWHRGCYITYNHPAAKQKRPINSCILDSINSLTRTCVNKIIYFDFIGNDGYRTQMFYCGDEFAARRSQKTSMPQQTFPSLIHAGVH